MYNQRKYTNAKHYCKYCNEFVTDNPNQRKLHDTNPKHKNNVQRHLNDLRKKADLQKKDEELARRIIGITDKSVTEKPKQEMPVMHIAPLKRNRDDKEQKVRKQEETPKPSSSVADYVIDDDQEHISGFTFKEKTAVLDEEQPAQVAFKKRKSNQGNSRKKSE